MDFDEDTISIVFPSGQSRICVEFNITDDQIALEFFEEFDVMFQIISDSTVAIPGQRAMFVVTIIDDDSKFRF